MDGTMTGETIDVCPNCDSAAVRVHANGKFKDPTDTGPKYGCITCGSRFEEPNRRGRKHNGHGLSGLARRLHDADVDEVGP